MKTSEVLQAVLTLEKYFNEKPKTNGDKIRSMTDEELGIWLSENTDGKSATGWALWLKQEVKE